MNKITNFHFKKGIKNVVCDVVVIYSSPNVLIDLFARLDLLYALIYIYTYIYILQCENHGLFCSKIRISQFCDHYSDFIMSAMASQIPGVTIVYITICSGADQRKHQSSASLAFVRGIHRWPVNSAHKGPVMRKMFPFDDVIMGNVIDEIEIGDT